MHRLILTALATSALCVPALAEPLSLLADPRTPVPPAAAPPADGAPGRMASAQRPPGGQGPLGGQRPLGGGFVEFLFGGGVPDYASPPRYQAEPAYPADPSYVRVPGYGDPADPAHAPFDPTYERQIVDYSGGEPAGTIIIDTPDRKSTV